MKTVDNIVKALANTVKQLRAKAKEEDIEAGKSMMVAANATNLMKTHETERDRAAKIADNLEALIK